MVELCAFASGARKLAAPALAPTGLALSPDQPEEDMMLETRPVGAAIAGLDVGVTTSAEARGMAQLTPLHREVVAGMPMLERQEIRVLFATLQPGDRTPRHSHRHPVTVYVVEGEFTLEYEGLPPVRVGAGEVTIEPAHVPMTGYNRGEAPARMVIYFACAPDEPFADPA